MVNNGKGFSKMETLKECVSASLQENAAKLTAIGDELWRNPELNYEEHKAHDLLTSFLTERGFSVKKGYTGLETAFRAEFGAGKPKVCILCEYDALPDIGHGCGHNLIAESGVAVGVALKEALESSTDRLSGTIVILGTPGEEGGGGKVLLIRNGAFEDLDIVMMAHPSSVSVVRPLFDAVKELKVVFTGRVGHEVACPWEGSNALDAAVLGYNAVSVLRQQFKPSWRVQMVISNGGVMASIIPYEAVISVYIKAPDVSELEILETRVTKCFRAASTASGCIVTISQLNFTHENIVHNDVLARTFSSNYGRVGGSFVDQMSIYGSTDMIKVSKLVPTLYVYYKIGNGPVNHSKEFAKISNEPSSHGQALLVAEGMGHTIIDLLWSAELQHEVQQDFKKKCETF